MTRDQAIAHLLANPSDRVEYSHRDATLSHWITVRCRIDNDGDLVQAHPTDCARVCTAPSGVEYRIVLAATVRAEVDRIERAELDDAGFAARDQAAVRAIAADYKAGRMPSYAAAKV